MEQLVRIVKCHDNGTAQVVLVRESACSGDCHKCSGCGAAKQTMLLDAENPIGAPVGATVVLKSESGPVLAGAAVLYMLPLVLFIAGYLLGVALWQRGGWLGAAAFVLGLAGAVAYDRLVMKKKKPVYIITGYGQ